MGLRNDQLFQKMKEAIEDYFSDRSVAPEVTKDRLEEVNEELSSKIGALEIDIARLNEGEENWFLGDPEDDD